MAVGGVGGVLKNISNFRSMYLHVEMFQILCLQIKGMQYYHLSFTQCIQDFVIYR